MNNSGSIESLTLSISKHLHKDTKEILALALAKYEQSSSCLAEVYFLCLKALHTELLLRFYLPYRKSFQHQIGSESEDLSLYLDPQVEMYKSHRKSLSTCWKKLSSDVLEPNDSDTAEEHLDILCSFLKGQQDSLPLKTMLELVDMPYRFNSEKESVEIEVLKKLQEKFYLTYNTPYKIHHFITHFRNHPAGTQTSNMQWIPLANQVIAFATTLADAFNDASLVEEEKYRKLWQEVFLSTSVE